MTDTAPRCSVPRQNGTGPCPVPVAHEHDHCIPHGGPAVRKWAIVGHWSDADEIEVEYVIPDPPADWQDLREDTGFWQGGLFAEVTEGRSAEEAIAYLRWEYEEDHSDPEPELEERRMDLVIGLTARVVDPELSEPALLGEVATYVQWIIAKAEQGRPTGPDGDSYFLDVDDLTVWTKEGYLADLSEAQDQPR